MTFDIPGAFVTTKTDEYVIMCLRGHLCEIMTKIDPKLLLSIPGLTLAIHESD